MERFENRVVITTGGTAGVGSAAALGFAKEGASVVINSRYEEHLQKTAGEIRAFGGEVTTVAGDITLRETCQRVVSTALEKYGRADVLFNYVGGSPDLKPPAPFMEQTESYWLRSIELNLYGMIFATRLVLDPMIKQKWGRIINMSAQASIQPTSGMVIYSAVKAGVNAFTNALSQEVAQHNITINSISPGPIDTPGAAKVLRGNLGGGGPVGGPGGAPAGGPGGRGGMKGTAPEQIADMIYMLASDDGAYITGQNFTVARGIPYSVKKM